MDIPSLEEIIQFSMVENDKKLQATQYLDQVRVSPDRWNVGLSLFFDGKSEVSQFFGLSLVRDYMKTVESVPETVNNRLVVREAMKNWLQRVLTQNAPVPNYIVNNVASILTLCIKHDYPELWPSAFVELLQIGHTYSFNGMDIVVRVLNDLEVEVVMFNEGRTKSEIAHNVIIKDTMRVTSAIKDCVTFLCSSAAAALAANMRDLADRTLLCLAEMVGWIDVHMTVSECLPTIYALFQDKRTRSSAASCLFELAKKGMDPIVKVQMVQSIGLLPLLAAAPIGESSGAVEAQRQVGLVVDMVLVELLGCWTKFEEVFVFAGRPPADGSGKVTSRKQAAPVRDSPRVVDGGAEVSPEALVEIAPTLFQLLTASMGVHLALLNHSDVSVSGAVFPSCNRLVALLKQQTANKSRIEAALSAPFKISPESYFLAANYLNPLLSGIYRQLYYPADFDFSGYEEALSNSSNVINGSIDDEENEVIEAKKEVRKLFVNCCRVNPERCLELLGAVLTALPQPISKSPFPPLEAALRLVHAFSECGPANSKYVNEGTFPALIAAIHSTDIAAHPHPQVLLSYFEISLRYIKLVNVGTIHMVLKGLVTVLASRGGNTSGAVMIRNKCAYFLVKISEAMDGKASQLLATIGQPLGDVIIKNARNPFDALTGSPSPASSKGASGGRLTDASELQLFETVGLMTASTYYPEGEEAAVRQYQQQLLSSCTSFLLEQIREVLSNRAQLTRYVELFSVYVAHKINCLSCLAKGHNFKTHADNVQYFDAVTAAVVQVLELMPQITVVRLKCVVFLHRMVSSLGPRCLLYVVQAMGLLIEHAEVGDIEETTLLFNQCMVEFSIQALPLANRYHAAMVEKFKVLSVTFETQVNGTSGAFEAPHIEGERAALQKLYLLYSFHVSNNNCYPSLTSPENVYLLEDLCNTVLVGLKGGRGRGGNGTLSQQAAIPIRKGAAVVLVGLMKVLCPPSPSVTAEAALAAGFPPAHATTLPPQLLSTFQTFMLELAVPTAISACCDGGRSLNVKDAAAQPYLTEVGTVLWILHHILGTQNTVSYLTGLLTNLGWNEATRQQCLQALVTPSPLGTYREGFKQFIRSCS